MCFTSRHAHAGWSVPQLRSMPRFRFDCAFAQALLLRRRASVHDALSDRAHALADLGAALSIHPSDVDALLQRARLHRAAGDEERCFLDLRAAHTIEPQVGSRIVAGLHCHTDRAERLRSAWAPGRQFGAQPNLRCARQPRALRRRGKATVRDKAARTCSLATIASSASRCPRRSGTLCTRTARWLRNGTLISGRLHLRRSKMCACQSRHVPGDA